MAGKSRTQGTTTRSRLTFPDRWDLTQLVKDSSVGIDSLLADLESKVGKLEAARPTLAPSMPSQDLLALLRLSEEIAQGSSRLGAYVYLDRKSTRLNSSHIPLSRMPSSA